MGNRAKFTKMECKDIDEVVTLENENFASPWHKSHFEYELSDNPFSNIFLLRLDNELIGYYGVWLVFEECQITTIAVKEAYKGKGYGKMLMNNLMHFAKENLCERVSLEVRVSNERAQNLYKQYGFETVTIRKSYYEDNHEDAYLMMKGI